MSSRIFYQSEQPAYSSETSQFPLGHEGQGDSAIDPLLGITLYVLLSKELKPTESGPNSAHGASETSVGKIPSDTTPQAFEDAFKRFEPMFHTVFYRKYHPDILADAKQVALLALYKQWCKDRTLLDQTAAFVTTAAVWGISNWRKKEMKRIPYERPLVVDNHGHVSGEPKTRNPRAWSDAIDFRLDLDRAVDNVLLKFNDHAEYRHIYMIVRDLVEGVSFQESWKKTTLPRSVFQRYLKMIKAELAIQLGEYDSSRVRQ